MNIILGQPFLDISNRHTVLELDTMVIDNAHAPITAYCLVASIPLEDLAVLESLEKEHQYLMSDYKNKDWANALSRIARLKGKWNCELDTFYEHLENRINQYTKQQPKSWSHVLNLGSNG